MGDEIEKMTPSPCYLYCRIYEKDGDNLIIYTGITTDMKRRQHEHNEGKSRTTNRFNKSFNFKEVFFRKFDSKYEALKYEKYFKKLTNGHKTKKVLHMNLFKRWTG